ncbi:MAG: hypothetical protein ABIG63_18565 [Chloroflexota bacterium]
MKYEKIPYFISIEDAPKLTQMVGLETTILTGLHGEKKMMSLAGRFYRETQAVRYTETKGGVT